MHKYLTKLQDFLFYAARQHSNKVALIFGKNQYTYTEINRQSDALAAYFSNNGVLKGQRILSALGNCYESVIIFWAALKAGATIVLIDPDMDAVKIAYIFDDLAPTLFVCNEQQNHWLQDKYAMLSSLQLVLVNSKRLFNTTKVRNLQIALHSKNLELLRINIIDKDLACIIYTSGSTGKPKGVMLTHRNILSATYSICDYLNKNSADIIASVLPLSFDYGLYQMIMAFAMGATLLLEPNFLWPAQFLKKINKFKVTVLPLVPTMIHILYEHARHFNYDLSSLRCITNTSAALNHKHISLIKILSPRAVIYSMYGLTECKRCTYLPPHRLLDKPNSIGIPIPNTEIWVIDEFGARLPANQIGELVVRGAMVMQGYWNSPEKTAEKLKQATIDGEKVLHTGDYGWFDEEGYLHFWGRKDEIVKCRGIKVNLLDIEKKLLQMEKVTEVTVIGVEDVEIEFSLHAFFTVNAKISVHDIRNYALKNLPVEGRPKYISILKNIPKNSNGKINKEFLKKLSLSELGVIA